MFSDDNPCVTDVCVLNIPRHKYDSKNRNSICEETHIIGKLFDPMIQFI